MPPTAGLNKSYLSCASVGRLKAKEGRLKRAKKDWVYIGNR